jgi:Ser/Thr protein kinase RdoA (MazF antagonist)
LDDIKKVAAAFQAEETLLSVAPYGSGNINDTYVVNSKERRVILQRINQHVFRHPELIMINLRTVMEHIATQAADGAKQHWELPQIVTTREGKDWVIDATGEFWRALTFIEGARTLPKVRDAKHAGEAGYALGRFQSQISDLDAQRLHDTLPGFHIMPAYLAHYDEVVATHGIDRSVPALRYASDFVDARRAWAPVLQNACAAGELLERPMHGDPKIDNIMIDDATGDAVSIIDLDTVKPGLVQYDIGDCLRSSCNPLGEETQEIDQVTFELDLCEAILKGYLPQVHAFYTENDYAYLFDSLRVLAFEMGLRFFTDYLEGNVYFKTHYPENNLMRTLVQFRLMEQIEAKEAEIRQMIRSLART